MTQRLSDRRIAILATDGFEQAELQTPLEVLAEAGAQVDVVSPKNDAIQGFRHFEHGEKVSVDVPLAEAGAADYDALVIPGGLFNPDQLRTDADAIAFTRGFFDTDKTVAAICHGPWVLINAEVVKDRRMTSVPSIRKDLENAGARWEDAKVITDRGLVTSRTPDDLDAFCEAIIITLANHDQPIAG